MPLNKEMETEQTEKNGVKENCIKKIKNIKNPFSWHFVRVYECVWVWVWASGCAYVYDCVIKALYIYIFQPAYLTSE